MYASLRQLFFPRAFRIARPAWSGEDDRESRDRHSRLTDAGDSIRTAPTSSDGREEAAFVAELATGLWRIQRKVQSLSEPGVSDELRGLFRHVESTLDVLAGREIEIRDDTGGQYVAGMALKVLAFQPTEGIDQETVFETIRPSVYYRGRLIQRGEVVVATPKDVDSPSQEDSPSAPSGPETPEEPPGHPAQADDDLE